MGFLELEGCQMREAAEEQRLYGVGPGEVDDFLVCKDRVGAGGPGKSEQESEDEYRRQNKRT